LGNVFFYELLNSGEKASTVIPFTALAPLVTVLLAVCLLREGLNRVQQVGVVISLVAMYLLSASEESGIDFAWLVLALAPIVLWGLAGLLQKMATNHLSARLSAIWFFVAFFPLAMWLMLRGPLPTGVSLGSWGLAIALGFALALGNLTILLAFASGGKASIIAPMAGLYPLISVPIAIVWFDEQISWRQSLGITLALAAVVTLSFESPTANSEKSAPNLDLTT
jgi:transporter family protein